MANGLIIRNPVTGVVEIEITTKLTRMVGQVHTYGVNGSIVVPEFASGYPYFTLSRLQSSGYGYLISPKLSASGTTLSWTYGANSPAAPQDALIVYGVYS